MIMLISKYSNKIHIDDPNLMEMENHFRIEHVTANNIDELGIYCLKNKNAPGYKAKLNWFKEKINKGLCIKIAFDENDKQVGFLEYIPSEKAWRPIKAKEYLFIQCIGVFSKIAREQGLGTALLSACEKDAQSMGKVGICTITSDGPWMATRRIFEKAGYIVADKKDRFELLYKSYNEKGNIPSFRDWKRQQQKYQGWHLIYSDQCPWHTKAVDALKETSKKAGIDLRIQKIESPEQAQMGPSGFGTFGLLHNGKLLEDHYISRTRFLNILKQELDPKSQLKGI